LIETIRYITRRHYFVVFFHKVNTRLIRAGQSSFSQKCAQNRDRAEARDGLENQTHYLKNFENFLKKNATHHAAHTLSAFEYLRAFWVRFPLFEKSDDYASTGMRHLVSQAGALARSADWR